MTEESSAKWPPEKVRIIVERVLLPTLTAGVARYLLNGALKDIAESFPPPYAELVAHPVIDNILNLLIFVVYFVLASAVGRWTFVGVLAFAGLEYGMVRLFHSKRLVAYVTLIALLWAAVVILRTAIYFARKWSRQAVMAIAAQAKKPEVKADSRGQNFWERLASDKESRFAGLVASLVFEVFLSKLLLPSYYIASFLASISLGVTMWNLAKLSLALSIPFAIASFAILIVTAFVLEPDLGAGPSP